MDKTLSATFDHLDDLKKAHMPLIKHFGLFIATTAPLVMGDCIQLQLNLPQPAKSLSTTATVVWVTPQNAQDHVAVGVGLQLPEEQAQSIRKHLQI